MAGADRATGHVWRYDGPRGSTWYAKFRGPDGRQMQRKLGRAHDGRGRCPDDHLTERMAHDALRRLLTDLERGTLAGAAPRSGRTFRDACDEFLRHRRDEKGLTASTLHDYGVTIEKILMPAIGENTPIEKITADDVQRVRDLLLVGRSTSTARKHWIVLHGLLERARRRKWIAVNPAADVERIPVQRSSGIYRALEPVQVQALERAAVTPQEAALYVVAAYTGLRLGELRALRWRHVRWTLDSILVEKNLPEHGKEKAPKSGRGRSVPLVPQAAKALEDLSRRGHLTDDEDHVFVNALGGPANGDVIRREWRAAMKRAGLGALVAKDLPAGDRLRFHDLRHTFGTLAARHWPLSDVQFYMGHADIQTTMIYVHAKPRTGAAADLGDLITRELGDGRPKKTAENFTAVSEGQKGETLAIVGNAPNVVPNVVPNRPIQGATTSN